MENTFQFLVKVVMCIYIGHKQSKCMYSYMYNIEYLVGLVLSIIVTINFCKGTIVSQGLLMFSVQRMLHCCKYTCVINTWNFTCVLPS